MGRAGTAALFAGLASLSLAQAVLLPVLGPVMRDIGLAEWQAGAVISVGALTAAVAAPVWGRVSDRRGRRGVFVAAVAAGAVTTAATGALLAAGQGGLIGAGAVFAALLVVRAIYAGLASGAFPAAAGGIGDTVAPDRRTGAMALTGTAFASGSLAGAALVFALGGVTGAWGPLVVAVFIGVAAFVAALRRFPETVGGPPLPATPTFATVPSSQGIRSVLASAALTFTAAGMVAQAVPFLVQDRGALTLSAAVWRAGLLTFAMSAATLAALALVQRSNPSPARLARLGGGVAAGSAAAMAVDTGLPGLVAAHLTLGLALGCVTPALQGLVSLRVAPGGQAAAAGALSAATVSGYIFGPMLGGLLYGVAAWVPFGAAAVVMALGWVAAGAGGGGLRERSG